jgi:hypothetical protein
MKRKNLLHKTLAAIQHFKTKVSVIQLLMPILYKQHEAIPLTAIIRKKI